MTKRSESEKALFSHWNYAHRGLYSKDQSVPENSLTAFRLAAENGYGAELDVQLTKDGYVVVFHDDTLDRVCKVHGLVSDYTLNELREMRLYGTEEKIPLFTDVLEAFGKGNGPLIVELKTGKRNAELCEKTRVILSKYKGVFCIESFDPTIVLWFKKNAPEIFRGQLATMKEDYEGQKWPLPTLLSNCCFSFLNQPDFIAYRNCERPKAVLRARKKGVLLVAWTSHEPEVDQVKNDAVIFEYYRPEPRF